MIRVNPYESPADAAEHETFDWPRAFDTTGYVAFVFACYAVTAPLWVPLALLAIVVLLLIGIVWLPVDAIRNRSRDSAGAAILLWGAIAFFCFMYWDDAFNDRRVSDSVGQCMRLMLRPIINRRPVGYGFDT